MTIRISGFNTGLDIDQIVKDLMSVKRQPLNKLLQQKTLIEWKRDQYRELSAKIVDLRNNKLFNYSMSSALKAKKATVSGTNASAITAKASAGAQTGTIAIEVISPATAAYARTAENAPVNATSSTKLTELGFTVKNVLDDNDEVIAKVIEVEINGVTISVNEDATVGDLVNAINISKAGVSAFFDDVTKRLSLTAKETGTGPISLSSNLESQFNLTDTESGSKARVVINGIETDRDNTFTVNGVEITIHGSTHGETLVINVGTDTDKIVETVKSFINDYNSLLETINKKLNEERYRDYLPLTSEQKEEMKEKEIELWEEKAKSGLLRNDSILSNLVNDFRVAMLTDVVIGGEKVNLAQYGIGTGDYTQRGKLVIVDEDKLRAKIEEDPDKFMALLTQNSSISDPRIAQSATAADSGLFRRLSNTMSRTLDLLAEKAGISRFSADVNYTFSESSLMAQELRYLNLRIQDMNARLLQIENNYYRQFTAMETAISRFNAQSAALSGYWN